MRLCPSCQGTGEVPTSNMMTCPACQGSGTMPNINSEMILVNGEWKFKETQACSVCRGRRLVNAYAPCPTCKGRLFVD